MQPNRVDLTKILKVGDKVWSVRKGEGIVSELCDANLHYPIAIDFPTSKFHTYTKYGMLQSDDLYNELYPSSAFEPWQELCPFEKGELCYVRNITEYNGEVCLRYFSHKSESGLEFLTSQFEVKDGLTKVWVESWKFSDCPLPPKIDVK